MNCDQEVYTTEDLPSPKLIMVTNGLSQQQKEENCQSQGSQTHLSKLDQSVLAQELQFQAVQKNHKQTNKTIQW